MINMSPEERKRIVASCVEVGCIDYSTKIVDEKLMLCPTVCGIKFCGWYLTTTECEEELRKFLESWLGELIPNSEGLVKC
ncbi:hypothetical protein [Vibrio diabolicus]|uniref:hypothetical protein n=1 Tax=Vibrio diabolicus TaxID=50719 RepID=UPI0035A91A6C